MVRYLSRAVSSLLLDRAARASAAPCRMEALEGRVLMSSTPLGFAVNFPLANILNLNVGSMSYNASTDSFDDQGTPQSFQIGNRSLVPINSPSDFELHIKVDNSGNLIGSGTVSSDLVLTGSIDVNGDGTPDYTGTLLTGTITQFGAGAPGANPVFQFRLTPTGGSLENAYFTGQDIGVTLNSENSNFAGFAQSFVGLTKAVVGPVAALPGSISGQVVDQCAGNAGLNGVKMDLTGTDALGNAVAESTTTANIGGVNGEYSFTNLAIGNYTVTEEQPSGYLQENNTLGTVNGSADGSVSGDTMSNIVIGSGQNGINYNFGEVEPTSIAGTVYIDTNNDGLQDNGEAGIPNVTITLTGTNDQGTITPIVTATDGSGNYSFTNLRPGTYNITENQPYGYYMGITTPGTPANGSATCSDITNIADTCGSQLVNYNFGNLQPATISGQVLDQCNNNAPINGVTIQLLDNKGNVINSEQSSNNGPVAGSFIFINIVPGTYQLREIQPGNYLPGTNAVGTVNAVVDGTVSGNLMSNIVLGSGASGINYNFGEVEPTSISGTVFKDTNANGTQDSGETGIQNVNITLTGSNDQGTISPLVIATDASGNYSFTNLRPGTYTVTETAPAGYVQGKTTAGNPINGSASGNVISAIVDSCGSILVGYTFAEQTPPPPPPQLCTISGTKFQDITGNGFSADDTPMAGITIQLFNNIGNTPFKTTVTGSNGTYSFANLPLGTYYVKEVCPSNEVRTGPALSDTYTINATAGINYGGNNFDNYVENCCSCSMSCLSFTITSVNGCVKTVGDLSGQTHEGDKVTANFCLKGPATLSLVSYTAPDAFFNANDASQQVVFQSTTQSFTKAGCYSETVICPDSNYQIDFVCGTVIDKLGPANSNIFYHAQNRFISGDNEGCNDAAHNLSSLSGNVFYDANNDGKLDNGEAGLGNVGVTLTGTDFLGNAVSKTTSTSSNGNYTFTGLRMGNYKVTEAAVSGYQQGKTTVGTSGGNANGNMISGVVLYADANAINYIFAEIKSACSQLSCGGFNCGGYSSCQPCNQSSFSCSSPVNQCDSSCYNLGCNFNCGQSFWC